MSISEQVKELRKIAKEWKYNAPTKPIQTIFNEAADTIEELSAKLQAAKMKNDGKWITDRLPTKEECRIYQGSFLVTAYTNKLTTLYMEYEYTTIRGKEIGRWIWRDQVKITWEIIAWQPLPEPYHIMKTKNNSSNKN